MTTPHSPAAARPLPRSTPCPEEAHEAIAGRDRVIAGLRPSAAAWTELSAVTGDLSLRDAAQVLGRDRRIRTGQNRLAQYLRDIGWLDRTGTPYQRVVDQGLMTARVRTRTHARTDERVLSGPQVRITVRGLGRLHALMVGHPSTGAVHGQTSR